MCPPPGGAGSDGAASRRPALRLVSDNEGGDAQSPHAQVLAKAAPLAFEPDVSLDDAIAGIFASCLDHFAANAIALRQGAGAEAIHQMRVALRRLRALFGLLKRVAPVPELAPAAEQARALAAVLGPARDWRVLLQRLEAEQRGMLKKERGFVALLGAVEARALAAEAAAGATVDGPAAEQFLRDMGAFVERRPWRTCLADAQAPSTAQRFARAQLTRLHRRALRRCEGVARLPPARRHEARIALKKARYAAEFFESLFSAKRAKSYAHDISELQERLGDDNDWTTAARLLGEIRAADGGSDTARAVDQILASRAKTLRSSLAKAKKSAGRVRKADRFWL